MEGVIVLFVYGFLSKKPTVGGCVCVCVCLCLSPLLSFTPPQLSPLIQLKSVIAVENKQYLAKADRSIIKYITQVLQKQSEMDYQYKSRPENEVVVREWIKLFPGAGPQNESEPISHTRPLSLPRCLRPSLLTGL